MSLSSPQADLPAEAVRVAAPASAIGPIAAPTSSLTARRFLLALDLPMRHAGPRRVRVRGEWRGPADAPWVVVAGGISAGARVASDARGEGWWPAQVGLGRAIDTDRRRVLAIDWLGADGDLDQPIDPADQADALAAVLDHLEVPRLSAFVGASYGAMVGLQFAARHGDRLDRLVAISGAHRPHPYASAWRALQRQVVALGRGEGQVSRGLALARQWAMLSYRTPEEFAERFDTPAVVDGERARVAAEDYLAHCGQAYAARWCSTAFLRLSESIDLQQVDPSRITTPTTVVAIAEDRLVPLSDLQALVESLGGPARLRVLRSRYGHDAFLKEDSAITRVLRESLEVVA